MNHHESKVVADVARYVRTNLTRIHRELDRPQLDHERQRLKNERRVLEPLRDLLLQDMRDPIQAQQEEVA